jgi:hypothetical protein
MVQISIFAYSNLQLVEDYDDKKCAEYDADEDEKETVFHITDCDRMRDNMTTI